MEEVWELKYMHIGKQDKRIIYGVTNFTRKQITIDNTVDECRQEIALIHEGLHVLFGPDPTDLGHYKLHIMSIIIQDVLRAVSKVRDYPVEIRSSTSHYRLMPSASGWKTPRDLARAILAIKLNNAKIRVSQTDQNIILSNSLRLLEARNSHAETVTLTTHR